MTPERWRTICQAFERALECEPSDQERIVKEVCGIDAELCDEVRRMLAQHHRSGPLDRPIWPHNARAVFSNGQIVAGRYSIVGYVGRGGMGEVYEARDLELGEKVALKTLLPDIAADTRMLARFKQEIQLSRKIGHPNVCRVFDLAREPADGVGKDTVYFLTMEFLSGETLATRLSRQGKMPPSEALPIIEQMAQALDAAHRAGVVHRDFKPSNVMLVRSGDLGPAEFSRAVVTDFGLARRITPSGESTATATGQLMGTIDYMAPELFAGAPATPASDLYALGLVAYKTVTGELPFDGRSPLASIVQRAVRGLPSASVKTADLDHYWARALNHMLDPEPARRFSTGCEFIAALTGDTHSITLKLPPITRRRIIGGIGFATLLLTATSAWFAWERSRARVSPDAAALYQQAVTNLQGGAYFAAATTLQRALSLAPGFALAHARLAEAWANLDLNEKASQEMLLARRQDLSALSRLDRLHLDAIDLTMTREFMAAAAKYEQMIEMAGPDTGDLHLDLGRAYENAGKLDQAIDSYQRAAEGLRHSPAAWLALGVLFGRKGNTAKAEDAFQQAEQAYRATNNLEGLTELAFQRGAAASDHGQFDLGSMFLNQALQTARLSGNVHQEVRSELWLSANAFRSGDVSLAETLARQGLATARINHIDSLAVRGVMNLGHAYNRKRDYAGAERFYREALGLARGANSARLTALSLLSLAAVHDTSADYTDSQAEASEALSFYQANAFAIESFQCLTILGRASLWGADDPKRAETFFQRALAEAGKTTDKTLQALAEESLGTALAAQERYPDALPHFQKELALSTTDERRGYAALNCGEILWLLGRYSEAADSFQLVEKSASGFPQLRLRLLRARAGMALSEGRFVEARGAAERALASEVSQDQRERSELKAILGQALAGAGGVSKGVRLCRESLDDALKSGQVILVIKARLALAQALIESNERSASLAVLRGNEPDAARHPEVRWRVLALMTQAGGRYDDAAISALTELERLWGGDAFRVYLTRPDVQRLSRPFLHSVDALHR